MDLTFEATFDGEVFRPTEKVDLEPNTKVKVTIDDESPQKKNGEPYSFLKYAKSVSIDAPADFAVNLDEYLYHGKQIND